MTMSERCVGGWARWLAVLAALALALTVAPLSASADEHDDELFCADVPPADIADRDEARATHRPNVDCVIATGISVGTTINDVTYYLPRNVVTRGQMATFIANTLDATEIDLPEPDAEDGVTFTDITGHTHADNIRRIANAGIVRGTGDNQFSPNAPITRQQMATFVVQAGAYAYDATLGEGDWTPDGDYFGDVAATNTHFANINLGFELALFSGTTPPTDTPRSGNFSPAVTVLRDQMATFLVNLAQFIFEGEWVEVPPEQQTPPVFQGSTPPDGATNVSTAVTPSANFDSPLSQDNSTATLNCDGNAIPGNSSILFDNVLFFSPNNPLPHGATCTANFTAVGTAGGSTLVQVSFVVADS
jgi:hypothetical protein